MLPLKKSVVFATLVLSALTAAAQSTSATFNSGQSPAFAKPEATGTTSFDVQSANSQGAKLTVSEDGNAAISAAPGLTVTPVSPQGGAVTTNATATPLVRSELKGYAQGMDLAAVVVAAVMVALAAYLSWRVRSGNSLGKREDDALSVSALKRARAKKKAEKLARKNTTATRT
jgi:hypothetical protein